MYVFFILILIGGTAVIPYLVKHDFNRNRARRNANGGTGLDHVLKYIVPPLVAKRNRIVQRQKHGTSVTSVAGGTAEESYCVQALLAGIPGAMCQKQSTGLDGSLVQSTKALVFHTPEGQISHIPEGQFTNKPCLYTLSLCSGFQVRNHLENIT